MAQVLDLNLDLKTKNQVKALVELGSIDPATTVEDFLSLKGRLKRTAIYRQIKKKIKSLS